MSAPSGSHRLFDADAIEAIRDGLNENAEELVCELLGDDPNPKYYRGRERRWGRRGSFSLRVDGEKEGLWSDFETGEGGDLFKLIRREVPELEGAPFSAVLEWAMNWLGWDESDLSSANNRGGHEEQEVSQEAEAGKVAWARRIWREAGPIDGTRGERYLRHTRAIPANGWPTAVRWHPRLSALVVAVTDIAGKVVAVQIIKINASAQKDETDGTAKRSFGPVSSGVVRLPGSSEGPILLAEGPETGLSAWAATGLETWIALGSVSKVQPPHDRIIVVCADDDPKFSPAARTRRRAVKIWRTLGIDVRICTSWPRARGDKSDLNDVMKSDGSLAVAARINRVLMRRSANRRVVTLEDGRDQMRRAVKSFFREARKFYGSVDTFEWASCVSLGVGKTQDALQEAKSSLVRLREEGDRRIIVYSVPEHDLSEGILHRVTKMLRGTGLSARIYRGREARRPNAKSDDKMCANIEVVREGLDLLADVGKEICTKCRFSDGCPYLQQSGLYADFWIVSHELLFSSVPENFGGIFVVIVDESPAFKGIVGLDSVHSEGSTIVSVGMEVPLDSLDDGQMPVPENGGDQLRFYRRRLQEAARRNGDGPMRREVLVECGFLPADGEKAAKLEWARKSDDGHWRSRTGNRSLRKMVYTWMALNSLMPEWGPLKSGRLSVGRNKDGVHVLRVLGLKKISKGWRKNTLVLDATLDIELLKTLWPFILDIEPIEVPFRNTRVRQCIDRAFSKSMLAPVNPKVSMTDVKTKDERRKLWNLRKLRAWILKIHRERGGRILVISNKAIIEALKLPDFVETTHFNRTAGHDEFRDVDTQIVIGRPMPSPVIVEAMAGALSGAAPETVSDQYPAADYDRNVRGVHEAGLAHRHPDPFAERVRWRICEGEVLQAGGRSRGVSRPPEKPLELFFLSDVALSIPVDSFLDDQAILGVSWDDLMLAEGGVAFESPRDAYLAYPQFWPSEAAAKKALQRDRLGGHSPIRIPIGKCPFFPQFERAEVQYRRAVQNSNKARAILEKRADDDLRAKLEDLVGKLDHFEVLSIRPFLEDADSSFFAWQETPEDNTVPEWLWDEIVDDGGELVDEEEF